MTYWLPFLTLLATFLSALATFLTVREIKRQRQSSYQPDLYIGNQNFYLYDNEQKPSVLPFMFSLEKSETAFLTSNLTIEIHNVGFAVSKAIKYQWSFDVKDAVNKISEVNEKELFKIQINKIIDITNSLTGIREAWSLSYELQQKNINYILPSIHSTPAKIMIPLSYIKLYFIFILLNIGFYGKRQKEYSTENFPPLILHLSYKDLQGKTHNSSFKLQFNLMYLGPLDTNEKKEKGYFILQASELKGQNYI